MCSHYKKPRAGKPIDVESMTGLLLSAERRHRPVTSVALDSSCYPSIAHLVDPHEFLPPRLRLHPLHQ
ncbi:unnamed protein product [Nippostrongylus brasiliensis]|uniref:SOS response associated peptidase (SRAP) n=1 Tax=Nippostrongylus brasiliensis TaxID=27835 RepID=A0A0N4Y2F2_NIPBR|nr:unnamed protein product [Nippostrongylus brasiliensis]